MSLLDHVKKKSLVSVRRGDIDGYGIQGFVVGVSETLMALEYVYDFQLDGIMVLRRSDITEVRRTATDEFLQVLMKRDGIEPGFQMPFPVLLNNWKTAIEQLSALHPLMILERELGPSPEFAIGRLLKATTLQVEFQTFSGTGRWATKPDRLKYAQLTCLQVNTRYLGSYQRHFECLAAGRVLRQK
jgi:hypothetical protein